MKGARSVRDELGWFGVFLLLSVAMTWPLVRHMSTAVSDPGDPFLNAWILNWDYWATIHQPFSLFQANIFSPARYSLAFSENLFGLALILFPFFAAGLSVITVYNIGMLLGFTFSGYGAFVLCRLVTRSRWGGLVGGIFFAFVPFRFDHLPHIQHVWAGWLPLLMASAFVFWRKPGWRRGFLVAAAYLMNGLTNVHWLLFGSVALALTAILLTAATTTVRSRREWMQIAIPLLCAGFLLLPFLLPYQKVSRIYGLERDRNETVAGSATPRDWIISPPANRIYGEMAIVGSSANERKLFPGLLVLLLTGVVVFSARREDFDDRSLWSRPSRNALGTNGMRALDLLALLMLIATFIYAEGDVRWKFGKFVVDPYPIPAVVFLSLVLIRFWFRYPEAFGGSRSLRELLRNSRFPLEIWTATLWMVIGSLDRSA